MAKNSKDASICSLYPVFGFGVTDGKSGDKSPSKASLVAIPAEGDLGRRDDEMKASPVCGLGGSGRHQSWYLFCAGWEGFEGRGWPQRACRR